MTAITFNKAGYDPFIDFLKGLCIVSVVLTHCIPYEWQQVIGFPFWGAQAVPVFLLIQSFHFLKHKQPPTINWMKLFRRIIFPFVLIQTIMVIIIGVRFLFGSGVLSTPLKYLLISGGGGPGSYYFWVYLQFALILLPLFGLIQNKWKLKPWMWLFLFVLVSEAFELLCSFIHISDYLYRLLAVRYIFLIYGGYIWVNNGIQLNLKTLSLSIHSIIAIWLFQYKQIKFEPWVFDTAWRYFHWFCYFGAMFALIIITNQVYKRIGGYLFDY